MSRVLPGPLRPFAVSAHAAAAPPPGERRFDQALSDAFIRVPSPPAERFEIVFRARREARP